MRGPVLMVGFAPGGPEYQRGRAVGQGILDYSGNFWLSVS
jgi:hypothetical protein